MSAPTFATGSIGAIVVAVGLMYLTIWLSSAFPAFQIVVADPGASGLGGITYVLISLADGREIAIDGSTPAPFAIDLTRLQTLRDEEAYPQHAVVSVPTTVAVLSHALRSYGTIELAEALRRGVQVKKYAQLLGELMIGRTGVGCLVGCVEFWDGSAQNTADPLKVFLGLKK